MEFGLRIKIAPKNLKQTTTKKKSANYCNYQLHLKNNTSARTINIVEQEAK